MDARSTAPLSKTPAPKHDVTSHNILAASDEFVALLGSEAVITNQDERRAHSNTPWSPACPSQTPALVVLPRSTSDVSAIMKICSRRRIPVTGFSGGTSLPGALTATRGGVCIDFKRMDKILAVHKEDMDVVVQPAVGWQPLNTRLEEQRLFFPPDPGPGAQIGGMVSLGRCCNGSEVKMLMEIDCYELFGDQCIPVRDHERMGDLHDRRPCRRCNRQNPTATTEIVGWV